MAAPAVPASSSGTAFVPPFRACHLLCHLARLASLCSLQLLFQSLQLHACAVLVVRLNVSRLTVGLHVQTAIPRARNMVRRFISRGLQWELQLLTYVHARAEKCKLRSHKGLIFR